MAHLNWLYNIFEANLATPCIVSSDQPFTYQWLLESISQWQAYFIKMNLSPGAIVALQGDFSPQIVAAFLALVDHSTVVVPLSPSAGPQQQAFMEIAEVQVAIRPSLHGLHEFQRFEREPGSELSRKLIASGHPGLVLFSSGSTGKSKAALHDFIPLLEKFKTPRKAMEVLTFLMIDHIGGINTLLYVLSNAGTAVTVPDRDPDSVGAAIERHKVELLPTSPTFLNLLLMSEAYKRYDLSSLRLITYGTEMMPERTLKKLHELFPSAKIQQTYGLSELGILRSKSQDSGSLWVKVGGEDFDVRVKDGTLWVKARSAMMGYLNAPSPFDEQGWLDTGDLVEQNGEYVRFLGRRSEIINVGGRKVYPAEVENVLLHIKNIKDATVRGERNLIMGNIVVARVNLTEPEDRTSVRRRVREFCRSRLESYKVPVRVEIVEGSQFTGRYKKSRLV
jgi:acyl-coenzyme A synthetase/AMP-(fatty) acid ligase